MENESLIRFFNAIKKRFEILEYNLDVAEAKIETLEKMLITQPDKKTMYVQDVREKIEHLIKHSRNPSLFSDLDPFD